MGGCVATLVLAGVGLGVTAVAGAASTALEPGQVTLVFASAQPLPTLPAPADGRLAGYGFVAKVTGDECGPSVGTGDAEVTAATNEDVCVFSLAVSLDQPDPTGISFNQPNTEPGPYPFDAQLVGAVSEGSNSVPISAGQLAEAGRHVDYAVAVGTGQAAVLTLSAGGFSQSFSLTAGRRVGTTPAALYRSPGAYELALWPNVTEPLAERWPQTDAQPGGSAAMDVTLSEVELDYFYPGDLAVHAPRPDEAYLGVVFSTSQQPSASGLDVGSFQPAADSDVTLRLPDGRSLPALAVVQDDVDVLAGTWVFLVPADLTAAEIVVSPRAQDGIDAFSRADTYGQVAVSFGRASWHIDLPGATSGGAGAATAESATTPGGTTAAPTTTVPIGQRSAQHAGPGVPVATKVVAGGGGVVVIVAVIVIPWRRRRARKGREATLTFPPPPALPQPPPPLGEQPLAGERLAGEIDDAQQTDEPVPPASPAVVPAKAPAPPREHRLVVRVLGSVVLEGCEHPPGRPVIAELAVYVALAAPATVSSATLRRAFGRGGRDLAEGTLYSYISRLRKALGADRLVKDGRGGFALEGELDCDWARFQGLCGRREGDRVAVLEEALSLVRGVPFAGIADGTYRWSDEYVENISAAIERAAHALVERYRAAGLLVEAAAAAAKGLVGVPESRLLHEDRLRDTAGDPARFEQAWRRCREALPEDSHLASLYEELRCQPAR